MDIECPSGLSGRIEGLNVEQASLLTDRRAGHEGTIVSNVLAASWRETYDPGPYQFKDDVDWEAVLTADRFYATLMVRAATYGPNYDFSITCQACREKIEWRVNLHEMPVKKLPDASVEAFKAGNKFKVSVTHDGKEHAVHFRLQDGAAERKAQRALRGSKNKVLTALTQRVLEVEGERSKVVFLRRLGLQEALAMLEMFDDADGGVESDIEVLCGECGALQTVALPFDQPVFWLPKKTASLA